MPALVADGVTVGGLVGGDEAREVFFFQRVRLAEGGHVRAQVVEGDFVRVPLVARAAREEEDVRLDALRVEDARGQAQDGVEVAFLHEVAADGLAVAVGEEDVVRQDDGGARLAVRLEAAVDVLEEVELLVARRVGEVVARGALAALFRAEGGICEDDVVAFQALAEVREGVAEVDLALDAVEHGVHEREAVGVVDEFAAGEGFFDLEVRFVDGEVVVVVRGVAHGLRGGDHEAERAAGGVVAALAGLGLYEARHDVDEDARGEVLARAGFLFAGVFLKESFVEAAEAFLLGGEPVELVDARDDFLEVLRLGDVGRGAGVDFAHAAGGLGAEAVEELFVVVLEVEAFAVFEGVPAVGGGDGVLGVGFLRHLEEEDVGELGDVLVVGDAVVPEDVAEVPELGYDFLVGHASFPPSVSS